MTIPDKQRLRAVLVSLWVLLVFCWDESVLGQGMSALERQQASLAVTHTVLGILSFVRWPEQHGALTLCVTGDTQYAGALSGDLRQRNGEPLHVERYLQNVGASSRQTLPPDVPPLNCNVLYLGRLPPVVQQRLFERFLRRSTLLISEADAECAVGHMFCLLIDGRRVGFNVNLDSLARSPLRVHPNVLKLARSRP